MDNITVNRMNNLTIEITKDHLRRIMRYFSVDLETAMVALELPRKERKTYRKIFEKALPKQAKPLNK